MIRAVAAKEGRKRDKHRGRVMLHIGKYKYHLSREEAVRLRGQLTAILQAPWKAREFEWADEGTEFDLPDFRGDE